MAASRTRRPRRQDREVKGWYSGQGTPVSALSIASASAPISRPSVPAAIAGAVFLQTASLCWQRRWWPEPFPAGSPATPASLGVRLPEGQLDPPTITLCVKSEFSKQLLMTPIGPCASGRNAQFWGPPPADASWRSSDENKLLATVKPDIFCEPGF